MTDLITAEEAEKLLDGTLLMELANEHRALLLQAIGTDDADAMVYSKDGKPTRRVSEMTSPAKQAADVISGMARTVIDLHAQLADAQAAQAMVAELRAERDTLRALCEDRFNEIARLAAANAALEAKVAGLRESLDNLLEAVTAEDRHSDRSLTITGPTINLKWLIEAIDEARAALATQEAGNA